jgi:tetratricopeptide (TPR) repeat protein
MTEYALGSSKLIASLLVIPDAIALVPNATDVISWAIKLIGLWVSAAVLWFVSFNGILQIVKLVAQGVRMSEEGIYPWRFAKLIRWEQIEAIQVDERETFSRFFFLKPLVRRLTLYVAKTKSGRLVPNYLPSFMFSRTVFDDLVQEITLSIFGSVPDSSRVMLATSAGLEKMPATQKLVGVQRVLVSALVAFGLLSFIGRKAIVNFSYNSGNRAFARHQIEEAQEQYQFAVNLDPGFAYAWEALGRTQLDQNLLSEARHSWQKALYLKPDYVEAEIWLARYDLVEGRLSAAKEKLDSALNFAPHETLASACFAQYEVLAGNSLEAGLRARKILKSDATPTTRTLCELVVAQVLLRSNQAKECLKNLSGLSITQMDALNMLSFYQTRGAAYAIVGHEQEAEHDFKSARLIEPENPVTLNLYAKLELAKGKSQEAAELMKFMPENALASPLTILNLAKLDASKARNKEAILRLEKLIAINGVDANSLVDAAELLYKLGARKSASEAALKALFIDHDNEKAIALSNLSLRPEHKD